MTFTMAALLVVLLVAGVLFTFEVLPPEVVALGVWLAIALGGLLPAERLLSGFGSETVLVLLGLLILTESLRENGVVDLVGEALLRASGANTQGALIAILLATAGLSAFISNTAATSFFLPVAFGLATRAKISPSHVMMPLAFASLLAGNVTLIGTSTNLVVSGILKRSGLEPIGLFEITPLGLPLCLAGLAYTWYIGRRLLPERRPAGEASLRLGLNDYLAEVVVPPGSSLIGTELARSILGTSAGLKVLRVIRGKHSSLWPRPTTVLEQGDVVLVEGSREEVLKVRDLPGIELKPEHKLAPQDQPATPTVLVEAVLLPGSTLIGSSLKAARVADQFDLRVLGVQRPQSSVREKLSTLRLRLGDVLLVQGEGSRLQAAEDLSLFQILGLVPEERPSLPKAWTAGGIFVATLLVAALQLMPLAVALLGGVFFTFLTRCLSTERAGRAVDWRVLALVACMLTLGDAMEHTGLVSYLATHVTSVAGWVGPHGLLAGFFFLTMLLTQPMSNQAAAAVVAPVAIQAARHLDLNPRTFAMMILVSASCSFITPLEPSCLMVQGPGQYRFGDYLRVGGLLTLLIYAAAAVLVPWLWPLHG